MAQINSKVFHSLLFYNFKGCYNCYTMPILRNFVFLLFLVVNAQRSQFDVNCPKLCHCNKTTVECRHTKIHGREMFLNIRPEAYPDLDTVVVTGNNIGDLAGSNIFGVNVTHRYVSLVNLSDNAISAIDSNTFCGFPAVEYFYLHDNAIERIGADPFRRNVRLRVLDMSNFFSSSVSLAERPRLLANTFAGSVNEFNNLQELILRDNGLTEILSDTFCKLNGLIRLHLSGNKMKKFNVKSGCLQNLIVLDLSGNEFSTLSTHLWEILPGLTSVDISSNPLNCDCDIMPVIKELSKSPTSSLNQGYAICAEPESRKGQNIFEIPNFACKSTHRFLYWTLFVVLFCAAMGFCRIYRNRIKLRHLPFIAGYSKLGGENEQVASNPEFV
ncbi:leucine Rich Repeat family protein [Loa loa]|uniref:Leucine Rich Repeat family protein n=2 Tax=Loa loa TaxID=7209 RepID=A0A1S0UAP9_LOALO|nr:leucine Rich Repeat family protein [Loa loa]EFO27735.1 leucine Rich Repeat family protein [Loa loa]